jgi:hypothetical protein
MYHEDVRCWVFLNFRQLATGLYGVTLETAVLFIFIDAPIPYLTKVTLNHGVSVLLFWRRTTAVVEGSGLRTALLENHTVMPNRLNYFAIFLRNLQL